MRLRKKKPGSGKIRIIRITKDYETPEPPQTRGGNNRFRTRRKTITDLLRDHPEGLFRAEIARETGYDYAQHASTILRNMVTDGVLVKINGKYCLNE